MTLLFSRIILSAALLFCGYLIWTRNVNLIDVSIQKFDEYFVPKKNAISPALIKTANDGQGGKGGGGNATGEDSLVLGGKGGNGGTFGGGRGGDGGGGNATGKGSVVIGGDGGDGGHMDGRGGKGAPSSISKLSAETLKNFGLRGDENFGSGGNAMNSPEYDRRLGVLNFLSKEYSENNPKDKLLVMRSISMPPIEWVNQRLSKKGENFYVELIDKGTDFHLYSKDQKDK